MAKDRQFLTDGPDDEAETKAINALATQLDDLSSARILSFGRQTEEDMAAFADIAVDQALGRHETSLSTHLGEIRAAAEMPATVSGSTGRGLFGKFFQSPKRDIERQTERFFEARRRIDTVALHLQDYIHQIDHGLVVLDRMFKANAEKVQELARYVEAGKLVLSRQHQMDVPAEETAPNPGLAAQNEHDRKSMIEQLERRVSDLDRSKVVTLGMLATIRQTQAIGEALVEQIQKTVDRAIPAWKASMVIHIQQMRQRHGLAALEALKDAARIESEQRRAPGVQRSHEDLIAALDKIEQLEKDAITVGKDGPTEFSELDVAGTRISHD